MIAKEAATATAGGLVAGVALWRGMDVPGIAPATAQASAPGASGLQPISEPPALELPDPVELGLIHIGPRAGSGNASFNGFRIQGELSAQNAGLSRWGSCMRSGHRYFIKEFLQPVFPEDTRNLTQRMAERRLALCERFFNERSDVYRRLALCQTGNIVTVREFFRHRSKYYAVTDWVDSTGQSISKLDWLDEGKKRQLCAEIAFNVATLHAYGIVHADLKADNLLLCQTARDCLTAKLIDFDASFVMGEPPVELQGDFVYLAPEAYLRMQSGEGEVGPAIDVFALGVIFHQIWTGVVPGAGPGRQYPFEAALAGSPLRLGSGMPEAVAELVSRMCASRPEDRPTAAEVFHAFSDEGRR